MSTAALSRLSAGFLLCLAHSFYELVGGFHIRQLRGSGKDRGCCPVLRKNGENPVDEWIRLLWAYSALESHSDQSSCSLLVYMRK